MSEERGFLYIATGEQYVREAMESAASFARTMPDIPLALFTDRVEAVSASGPFVSIEAIEQPQGGNVDKILSLKRSPFARTVFLDSDTYSINPCYELFDLLDHYECALAHAPIRESWRSSALQVPAWFPEFNTGVIAYRNSSPFCALVDEWYRWYQNFSAGGSSTRRDQPAFRQALFNSSLNYYVLLPEYNLRSKYSYFVGGMSEVKILHDRGRSLDRARRFAARHAGQRSAPTVVDCRRSWFGRIWSSLRAKVR